MSDYAGVILAAGVGKRMGPLGEHHPKALLPVGGQPLIGHHLFLFYKLGVRQVFIVIGHLGRHIVDSIGDGSHYNLSIQYVEQGAPLGSAFALGRVKPYITKPFFLALGDYYFEAAAADRLVRHLHNGVSAICAKLEPNRTLLMEACELQASSAGQLERIVEKPCAPRSSTKGCGFYAFQPNFLDSVARTPRTALRDEYELSVAIDVHMSSSHVIQVEQIIDLDWNFTRATDVLDCNLRWLRNRKKRAFVGSGAQVAENVILEDVVVGAHASVEGTTRLRRGVVFPNTTLNSDGCFESVLVTPGGILKV